MAVDLYEVTRCDRCGGLLSALERAEYDGGDVVFRRVALAHDEPLCSRILALRNEYWPPAALAF